MKLLVNVFLALLIPAAAFRSLVHETETGLSIGTTSTEVRRNLKAGKGGYYGAGKGGKKAEGGYYGKGKGGKKADPEVGYYGKGKGGKKADPEGGYYGKGKGGKKAGPEGGYYGKGKGGKKEAKGKNGKGGDDCSERVVVAKRDEILNGATTGALGEILQFPVYDPTTMEQIGIYQDAAASFGDGKCVFNGAISVDWNSELESYDSQVNIAATCKSTYNSIIGGSGSYACATGFAFATEDGQPEGIIAYSLYICNAGCGV